MLLTVLAIVVVLAVAAGFAAELVKSRRRSDGWLDDVMRKRIVVHTRDDKSIEGVLMAQAKDGIILRAAKLLGENHAPDVEMAGEAFVPRANVAFAQLDE